ncbi:MAG: bifunctional diaminohydroxyphosphoribosylaminopyrimidine deaminase/5-amino-6-(5-phosphoribosylamino)uracil reductase RibD [Planctomycetota bacterium]|nr:bifunctional diaminohydroxyphosphoribosylaminopyrimidine deaminase/5-amino-6-(5-phosphoribosylamino)uracil reductase RibD [Planctomycetota bacterium]
MTPEIRFPDDTAVMRRAIELARRGDGAVEPNPMVGAVLVDSDLRSIAEGWHQRYGGPHAEVHALACAGERARGATLFVTLEPCAHHGKTPPCADAVIQAGIARVIVGSLDPFPQVDGRGIAKLRAAGIAVETGLLDDEVRCLNAPFRKLVQTGLPWVHAKWAMTLDGRIASRTGESKWISNPKSRQLTHALRGRMDGILVGIGTALADDPLLTARPTGPRTALRIVVDSQARLPVDSQLVRTAGESPVLVATTIHAPADRRAALEQAGVEVVTLPTTTAVPQVGGPFTASPQSLPSPQVDLRELLLELGRRRLTNLFCEGGGSLLGSLHDAGLLDELHVFVAPKLLGGAGALSPILGTGRSAPPECSSLVDMKIEVLDQDVYIHGRVRP